MVSGPAFSGTEIVSITIAIGLGGGGELGDYSQSKQSVMIMSRVALTRRLMPGMPNVVALDQSGSMRGGLVEGRSCDSSMPGPVPRMLSNLWLALTTVTTC